MSDETPPLAFPIVRVLRDRVHRLERENEELRLRLDTCNRIMAENVKDVAALISTMAKGRT